MPLNGPTWVAVGVVNLLLAATDALCNGVTEVALGTDPTWLGRLVLVMIGSDIYGWVVAASRHRLHQDGTRRLVEARAGLSSSLDEFPARARSYYELLVRLADAAINSAG
jgi:hypothetical protein